MKYFKKICVLTAIGALLSSSNLLAADDMKLEMAVGRYWKKDDVIRPLIVLSNDQGLSWYYAKNTQYSCSEHYATPLASCSKDFCIISNSCNNQLFVALSVDQGKTWADHEIPLPINNVYPHVTPSCNSQICVFAGDYINHGEERNTIILGVTKNKGMTWTYPTIPNFPDAKQFRVGDVSCTDNSCVIVGTYNYTVPFVITSTDQGETWSSMKIPYSGEDAGLGRVRCEGESCVAIGTASDAGNVGMNYIITSTNAGRTWKKSTAFAHPFIFGGMTCNGNICVVVGHNDIFNPKTRTKAIPFVAVSQNQGDSWIVPVLPFLKESAELNDISCVNKHCVAVGSFWDKEHKKAFLAISRNGGLTWSYKKDLPNHQFSLGARSALTFIHCAQTHCIAGGSYSDASTPWMILSQDEGETWVSPSTAISELPIDLAGGVFLSGKQ